VQQPGRDAGRRMVVAPSNCSRIVVVTTALGSDYDYYSNSIRHSFDARDGLLIKGHWVHSDVTGLKCLMIKFFKEPTRQGISWRWLLAGKSDFWVMLCERISWKPLHWPEWLKANELEEDKGKRSWTRYLPHVEINGTSTKFWKFVETV